MVQASARRVMIVVDHEQAQPGEVDGRPVRQRVSGRHRERKAKPEHAAAHGAGLGADLAVHQLDQLLADGRSGAPRATLGSGDRQLREKAQVMARRFERKKTEQHTGEDAGSAGRESQEEGLSEQELGLHHAEAIPGRAALSVLNANVSIPLDPSVAADVLSGMAGEDEDGPDEPPGEGAGDDPSSPG